MMTCSEHSLGSVIRKYRKERGLTQYELAEKAELSHRQVMSIERGRCYPKFENLCRLVRVLNIPPDHIFHSNSIDNDVALDSFIELYRSCTPEDKETVLATMQTLVDHLADRRNSTSTT